MPDSEYILGRRQPENRVPVLSRYLQVLMLYSCPICGRWTIHMPRYSVDGNWWIDHKIERRDTKVPDIKCLVPVDSCYCPNELFRNHEHEYTRTVIRVYDQD
jgi:hypothetical protein